MKGHSMQSINIFAVAGGILIILGVVLAFYYKKAKQLLEEMWAVDTYEAKELKRLCSGDFNAIVEVQGNVTCDNPLTSLAARLPCCWFRTVVEREHEETHIVTERDSEGHTTTRTKTDTDWHTDFDRTFSTIFKVNDKTGFTLIDPTNSDIDTDEVCNSIRFDREPWFDGVGYSNTGRYRVKEEVFIPTGYAYVLGEASICNDNALVHYPKTGYMDPKKKYFVISRKTEQQLTQSKQTTVSVCFWFAAVAILFGLFCLIVAGGLIQVPVNTTISLQ